MLDRCSNHQRYYDENHKALLAGGEDKYPKETFHVVA